MTQTNKEYAMQLYMMANEFYQVYPVLVADSNKHHDFIGAKHYNLCHALELALKGWLAYTGKFSENQLAQKFGHDLKRLIKKVQQLYGRSPELDACRASINALNRDYSGKSYEYPRNGGRMIGLADHSRFAKGVEALIQALLKSIMSGSIPEKPLPVPMSEKNFLVCLGDLMVRLGLWLKKVAI